MMNEDTTSASYWLSWRAVLCGIWVPLSMIVASVLIWRYEGPGSERREGEEPRQENDGTLYGDEVWRPCLRDIHPAWLLAYRFVAFFILLGFLVLNIVMDGGSIFYYYTQWTFALVAIYFGLGSMLSTYGCHQYFTKEGGNNTDRMRLHAWGTYMPLTDVENSNAQNMTKASCFKGEQSSQKLAKILGYVFQIIFQTVAGAVLLTDSVFWLIIFPLLSMAGNDLNFIKVVMHSVNAVFLLGDTALNCLHFRWFRISYFLLWTSTYVIFQWVVHGCTHIWWPYPFLDLSFPHAPIWYFAVAAMHIPCYAIFYLIIKLKHCLLTRWFPHSYIMC